MSQDLFESLLPPIKNNYDPKTEIESEKIDPPNSQTIDYEKIWDDIDTPSQQLPFNEFRVSSSNPQGKIVYLSNNKRKSPPNGDMIAAPSAKTMKYNSGDESRRILQSVLANRTLMNAATQQIQNNAVVSTNLITDPENHEEEEEGRTSSEIYAQYVPLKLKKGRKHPYPVVESSSLSSVEVPNIRYTLEALNEFISQDRLSCVQLESVYYACQRHEEILPSGERAGFLIGDGAGVGKGRILAAIIYENYIKGRKRSLWVSVSNDLRHDAQRDLRDLGADNKISVYPLNKLKYAKINSPENGNIKKGVLYCTYASLIGECQSIAGTNKYKSRFKQIVQWFGNDYDGVIVFDECHKAKNLMPQGSQKKTKTAEIVLKLQEELSKARIVYASATGASEPRNMAYMTRLGLWGKGTPFGKFEDFVEKLEDRVGAMELLAVDMKQRGMYLARQLSFADVTFGVHEVLLEHVMLGDHKFIDVYAQAVLLWRKIHVKTCTCLRLLNDQTGGGGGTSKWSKSIWSQFWAAHQRFFKYLVMAGKVAECVKITMEAITDKKCVVIGLQSTGEAKTQEMLAMQQQLSLEDGEQDEFVSCAKGIIQTFVERFFPTRENIRQLEIQQQKLSIGGGNALGGSKRKSGKVGGAGISLQDALSKEFLERIVESEQSNANSSDEYGEYLGNTDTDVDSDDSSDFSSRRGDSIKTNNYGGGGTSAGMSLLFDDYDGEEFDEGNGRKRDAGLKAKADQHELLEDIKRLAPKLPINTLDALIRELGGTDYVAEMTGRKGRMVLDTERGVVNYESRREENVTMEQVNLVERERFNNCHKLVAIISDAASTGISLHADKRYANHLQRVHITLELPWSADRAIQQFGRTHRSNQSAPPQYVFLISNLAGERRFASTVAKRLESLGALTHGDRRAAETRDLSQFNIDNKFGRKALDILFDYIWRGRGNIVAPPPQLVNAISKHASYGATSRDLIQGLQDELNAVGLQPKDSKNVSKFLNRILGMRLEIQNGLFQFYTDTMDELVKQAKKNQEYDRGIIDLAKENDNIFVEETRDFFLPFLADDAKVTLHRVKSITGMSWVAAKDLLATTRSQSSHDGFYETKSAVNKKIILAIKLESNNNTNSINTIQQYIIYSPNVGEQTNRLDQGLLLTNYNRLLDAGQKGVDKSGRNFNRAEYLWNGIYSTTEKKCLHYYWYNSCSNPQCEVGCRSKIRYVLSGSIFYIWDIILQTQRTSQLARVRLNNGKRIMGCLINHSSKEKIIEILSSRGKNTIITNMSQSNASTSNNNPHQLSISTTSNISNIPLKYNSSDNLLSNLSQVQPSSTESTQRVISDFDKSLLLPPSRTPINLYKKPKSQVLLMSPSNNNTVRSPQFFNTNSNITSIKNGNNSPLYIRNSSNTLQHSISSPGLLTRPNNSLYLNNVQYQNQQNPVVTGTPAQVKIVSLQSNSNINSATTPIRVSSRNSPIISASSSPITSFNQSQTSNSHQTVRLVPAQNIRSSTVPRLVQSTANITHFFNRNNNKSNNDNRTNSNKNSVFDEVIEID